MSTYLESSDSRNEMIHEDEKGTIPEKDSVTNSMADWAVTLLSLNTIQSTKITKITHYFSEISENYIWTG